MKSFIVICWFLALPGILEISLVGIAVDMGGAQDLMAPAAIIETVQPRLETLGYRVAVGPTLPPNGLWLLVNCQVIGEKAKAGSSAALATSSNQVRIVSPPCQLAYRY